MPNILKRITKKLISKFLVQSLALKNIPKQALKL
jgi:preprotein translocase subunit SecG